MQGGYEDQGRILGGFGAPTPLVTKMAPKRKKRERDRREKKEKEREKEKRKGSKKRKDR